jgi:predicted  nucleic acid-binding Zn-ribbon protein
VNELGGKLVKLEVEKQEFSTKIGELEEEQKVFSTKMEEMQNIFQQEKNELLFKIQELNSRKPEDTNKSKMEALQNTIQNLQKELREKSEKILQMEKSMIELKNRPDVRGTYLRSSNLRDNL